MEEPLPGLRLFRGAAPAVDCLAALDAIDLGELGDHPGNQIMHFGTLPPWAQQLGQRLVGRVQTRAALRP